jgi:hypothetical protein
MNKTRTINRESILPLSTHSRQVIRQLYEHKKSENPKFSLEYICRQAKLPSKGYLGDVMSGRRRLNPLHAKPLAKILNIEGLEKKIFLLMIQKESARSIMKSKVLEKQILSFQSQLKNGLSDFPTGVDKTILFTRVFCSLGLFPGSPTRKMICDLFSEEPLAAVENVINQLVESQAVHERDGLLSCTSAEIMFANGIDKDENISYVASHIEYARNQIRKWYPEKEKSYFSSSIVSVKRSKYKANLKCHPMQKILFTSISRFFRKESQPENLRTKSDSDLRN